MQAINTRAAKTCESSVTSALILRWSFLTVERWPFKCPASLFSVELGVALEVLEPVTAGVVVEMLDPAAATPPPPFAGLVWPVGAYTEMSLVCRGFSCNIAPQAITHSRPATAAHTGTTQNSRIHELGTEADHPTVISTQRRRINASSTTYSLVARGSCVVPQGSVPAPVRVEANAACLRGIVHSGEARCG